MSAAVFLEVTYWLHHGDQTLMAVQRHLLDSVHLERHEAAAERGFNTRQVCFRDL